MISAVISEYIPFKSWDVSIIGQLEFNNLQRCLFFAEHYTNANGNLVRVYVDGNMYCSYRFGKMIWNCY